MLFSHLESIIFLFPSLDPPTPRPRLPPTLQDGLPLSPDHYWGLYLAMEKIERGGHRVNVSTLDGWSLTHHEDKNASSAKRGGHLSSSHQHQKQPQAKPDSSSPLTGECMTSASEPHGIHWYECSAAGRGLCRC